MRACVFLTDPTHIYVKPVFWDSVRCKTCKRNVTGDSNDDDDNVDKNVRNLFMLLCLFLPSPIASICFDILR